MTSQEHWIGRVLSAGLTALLALTLTGFTAVVPATASVETPGAESDTVAAEVETELLSEPADGHIDLMSSLAAVLGDAELLSSVRAADSPARVLELLNPST